LFTDFMHYLIYPSLFLLPFFLRHAHRTAPFHLIFLVLQGLTDYFFCDIIKMDIYVVDNLHVVSTISHINMGFYKLQYVYAKPEAYSRLRFF
jgi:hypothetical protein